MFGKGMLLLCMWSGGANFRLHFTVKEGRAVGGRRFLVKESSKKVYTIICKEIGVVLL